jgi:hypothetical protein
MNGWVADLISKEVADKFGKVWGLGSDTTKDPGPWEGEQRNMRKPSSSKCCGSTAAICTSRVVGRIVVRSAPVRALASPSIVAGCRSSWPSVSWPGCRNAHVGSV